MSCWGLEIVSVVVPWSSFWCLLVSPLRYQVGWPFGNCLQASWLLSFLWWSGYLPSKGLFLGHAAGHHSEPLSGSRASVCLSPCWVSQSFLAMTCGLPWFFLRQKQPLPFCRGWCALAKEAAQVVFWLLQVGHGGTVGGCSSKACSPFFCLWGWLALLPGVCSPSAAGHWHWCPYCCQCQVLCTACQSGFGTSASLPFCSSSWVPSSERWSVLSVSLSVQPTGGRCLPAGCEPPCHISSEYPRLW